MLLADIKKLKVAELRAMLTERGLDPKGLKAELVVRLISAIEADVEPIKSVSEEDISDKAAGHSTAKPLQKTNSLEGDRLQSSKERAHTYTDRSTQTDPCQLCLCNLQRQNLESTVPELHPSGEDKQSFALAHPVALTTESGPLSGCSSSLFTTAVTEDELQQESFIQGEASTQGEGETEQIKSPINEKGRDYYEFKEDILYNRAKTPDPLQDQEEAEVDLEDVRLDSYNCDLHFEVGSDGCSGQPMFWEKFPLLRSGCRLTHGLSHGNVGFEVKFVRQLSETDPHMLRVGWSVVGSSLQLGETELSYGYDGRGRIVSAGREEDFGEGFTKQDVIGCYASFGALEISLSFHKNGRPLGDAFLFPSSDLKGQALFPHVLCQNCSVSLNLNPKAPWHPCPAGFCALLAVPPGRRTRGPSPASSKQDCEVLMMVGLPGSGKTHWAQAHMLQNQGKRYNLLSTNSILDCMEAVGGNQTEQRLQQAAQCVTQLIKTAASKRRNYIIDQANLYPSAQKHKMMHFQGFQRRAVVVFPSDEVWQRRLTQRQESSFQELSLLKAKVSFMLPEKGDHLDEVMFVELCSEEAAKLLTCYKEEARRLLPAPPKRKKHKQEGQTGWRRGPFNCQNRHQKPHVCRFSPFGQSYGCSSDPLRYRKYYRPYTGQWGLSGPSQVYSGTSHHGCPT